MRLGTVVHDLRVGLANAMRSSFDPAAVPEPPRRFVSRVGGGDYRVVGRALFGMVLEQGRLRPDDRLLDIGCGVGRLAAPLTEYLDAAGRYEGFDVDPELVAWCERNITRRHPRFRFRHVSVRNDLYRPDGSETASEFSFPYESGAFDVVVATSLFTHLLTRDAENYLGESARVLAPRGRLVATFFLLDRESLELQASGRAHRTFAAEPAQREAGQAHHVQRTDRPEAAVAYPAEWLQAALARIGFGDVRLYGGGWAGRASTVTYQDLVVATKAD